MLATKLPVPAGRAASTVAQAVARAHIVPLTVEQYARMIAAGIVPEDTSVELINGALVRKDRSTLGEEDMGQSPLHSLVVSLLAALAGRVGGDRHMRIQAPLECPPDAVPEPDAAIVRGGPRDYSARLPRGRDAVTVVEVAHSSLVRDREDKLPIYAAAAIPQYVIINLQSECVEVYEDPDPSAEVYRTKRTLTRGAILGLGLDGDALTVLVDALLP